MAWNLLIEGENIGDGNLQDVLSQRITSDYLNNNSFTVYTWTSPGAEYAL